MSFLFVYGTLLQEFQHEVSLQLKPYLRYVCKGSFLGRLFEVQNYPAAIASTKNAYLIQGDIFEVLDEEFAWPILDTYEECSPANPAPHEYLRKRILVSTEANETVSAWIYLYNYSTEGLQEIPSGDYLEYRSRK